MSLLAATAAPVPARLRGDGDVARGLWVCGSHRPPLPGTLPRLGKPGTAALLLSQLDPAQAFLPSLPARLLWGLAGLMARVCLQERAVKPGLAAVLAGCSLSCRNPPEVHEAKLSGRRLLAPGRLSLASVVGGEPGCSLPGHRGGSWRVQFVTGVRWQRVLGPAPSLLGLLWHPLHSSTQHRRGQEAKLTFAFASLAPSQKRLHWRGERGRRAPWSGARALFGGAPVPALSQAREEAVRAWEPGFVSTEGCAASWPPAPMDAVPEMLAQGWD